MDKTFLEILLATTNLGKQGRLRWLLEGLPQRMVLTTPDVVLARPQVQEDGPTHRDNAIQKATAWSQAVKGLAIASDGGFLIPALGKEWDSLKTHRFAGEAANDRTRLEQLLTMMAPFQGDERRAYWLEAVAIAENGVLLGCCQAQSNDGLLATSFDSERISPGFWAATIWYLSAAEKTYAEMDAQEAAEAGDHWGRLKPQVQQLLRNGYG